MLILKLDFAKMNSGQTRVTEAQKKVHLLRPPEQKPVRKHEQRPVQTVAPQVAYRRAQASGNGLTPADLLAMQRTVGNRQVQRRLAGRTEHQPIQAKLTVAPMGDQSEQAAEQVARQVPNQSNLPTLQSQFAQRQGGIAKENKTSLPDHRKAGTEDLSGIAMDDPMPKPSLSRETIQRFAFIKETQVGKAENGLTSEMKSMVSDNLVRNYESLEEFNNHAAKKPIIWGIWPVRQRLEHG